MRVLWITNILFHEALEVLTGQSELNASGGWLVSSAKMLQEKSDILLAIGTVSVLVDKLCVINGKYIKYYVIPFGKGNTRINHEYEKYWAQINKEFKPDIVHIHGTELSHGLAYIDSCGASNVIVSIQGLTSEIAKYYTAGISFREIISSLTLRELFKGSIYQEKSSFKKRGIYEKEIIRKVKYIIGRTTWDYAHVYEINPDVRYFKCNETLRDVFYCDDRWSVKKCKPYSIFLSQGSYTIKGLHLVLKAIPLLRVRYPSVTLRIAGADITNVGRGIGRLVKLSGYANYIKRLIHNLNLEDCITFLGELNALQMKKEYLNCSVFVCPSSIENSPNSIAEAQVLGVPVVASFVGGIPDFMEKCERFLYRYDDTAMLSQLIGQIWDSPESIVDMSSTARERHDPIVNYNKTVDIYKLVLEDRRKSQ